MSSILSKSIMFGVKNRVPIISETINLMKLRYLSTRRGSRNDENFLSKKKGFYIFWVKPLFCGTKDLQGHKVVGNLFELKNFSWPKKNNFSPMKSFQMIQRLHFWTSFIVTTDKKKWIWSKSQNCHSRKTSFLKRSFGYGILRQICMET